MYCRTIRLHLRDKGHLVFAFSRNPTDINDVFQHLYLDEKFNVMTMSVSEFDNNT